MTDPHNHSWWASSTGSLVCSCGAGHWPAPNETPLPTEKNGSTK